MIGMLSRLVDVVKDNRTAIEIDTVSMVNLTTLVLKQQELILRMNKRLKQLEKERETTEPTS